MVSVELCWSCDRESAEAYLAASHPVIKRRALLSHITHRVGPFREIWASFFSLPSLPAVVIIETKPRWVGEGNKEMNASLLGGRQMEKVASRVKW